MKGKTKKGRDEGRKRDRRNTFEKIIQSLVGSFLTASFCFMLLVLCICLNVFIMLDNKENEYI